MESKKQCARVMSIALMLSVIVPIYAIDYYQAAMYRDLLSNSTSSSTSRSAIYRKCSRFPQFCTDKERAIIQADIEKAGAVVAPLLFGAASAIGLVGKGAKKVGQWAAAAEPARIRLYRKCIAGRCDAVEKAQVRADLQKAKVLAKKTGKRVGLIAGALLLAAAVAIGVRDYRVEQEIQAAIAHERWLEDNLSLPQERQKAQSRAPRQRTKKPRLQDQEQRFQKRRVKVKTVPKVPGQRAVLVEPEAEMPEYLKLYPEDTGSME